MKKFVLLAGLYCLQPSLYATPDHFIATSTPENGNERALEHFKINYSEAKDPAWYTMPDKTIYCTFHEDGKLKKVIYDRHGFWRFTQIGYTESGLVKNVKDLVAENFFGYHISYVNEIISDKDEPVYIINIENSDRIKVIRVKGDEFEIRQDLEKS